MTVCGGSPEGESAGGIAFGAGTARVGTCVIVPSTMRALPNIGIHDGLAIVLPPVGIYRGRAGHRVDPWYPTSRSTVSVWSPNAFPTVSTPPQATGEKR